MGPMIVAARGTTTTPINPSEFWSRREIFDLFYKLVADRDVATRLIGPIQHVVSAPCHSHGERMLQAQRCKKALQPFEDLLLLHSRVDRFILRVRRLRTIINDYF